ncbi:MAG: TatD family hydrolase [Kofleriaceae bacterium]
MIDTHCHLDDDAFAPDRDAVVARAGAAGVRGLVVPAVRPRTWPALRALAARHAAIRIGLGVHPQVVAELDDDERAGDPEATLAAALEAAGPVVVAVGECGLDGAAPERDVQARWLRAHLRVARALGLPVILHAWRCHDVLPALLREERIEQVGGILHSYSGGADLVPVYADLGLHFGIAGPITYPGARRPIAAARAMPIDRIVVETDAPDQAPAPHRGGRNEPAYLPAIVAALAAARGEDPAELAAATTATARRLLEW